MSRITPRAPDLTDATRATRAYSPVQQPALNAFAKFDAAETLSELHVVMRMLSFRLTAAIAHARRSSSLGRVWR